MYAVQSRTSANHTNRWCVGRLYTPNHAVIRQRGRIYYAAAVPAALVLSEQASSRDGRGGTHCRPSAGFLVLPASFSRYRTPPPSFMLRFTAFVSGEFASEGEQLYARIAMPSLSGGGRGCVSLLGHEECRINESGTAKWQTSACASSAYRGSGQRCQGFCLLLPCIRVQNTEFGVENHFCCAKTSEI